MAAVQANDVSAIDAAIRIGVDPDLRQELRSQMDRVSTEQSFEVPLVLAVSEGHAEAAEALLRAKADPNLRAKGFGWGETPLLLAVRLGKTPLVSLLLRYGADPNLRIGPFQAKQRLASRANALSYAVTYERVESAELLLLAGAPAGPDDLARAISSGQTDIAYLLLAAGVNPRLVSNRGRTAIQEASRLPVKQREAMMALIEPYLRPTVD